MNRCTCADRFAKTRLTEEFVDVMLMKQSDRYVLWVLLPEKNYASIERSEISICFCAACVFFFSFVLSSHFCCTTSGARVMEERDSWLSSSYLLLYI